MPGGVPRDIHHAPPGPGQAVSRRPHCSGRLCPRGRHRSAETALLSALSNQVATDAGWQVRGWMVQPGLRGGPVLIACRVEELPLLLDAVEDGQCGFLSWTGKKHFLFCSYGYYE